MKHKTITHSHHRGIIYFPGLFLLLMSIFFYSLPVFAAEQQNAESLSLEWFGESSVLFKTEKMTLSQEHKNQLASILADYAVLRAKDFSGNQTEQSLYNVKNRVQQISEYEKIKAIKIQNAIVTWVIYKTEVSQDKIILNAEEWTFADYDCTGDKKITCDTFGYSNQHQLVFTNTDNTWKLKEDICQESITQSPFDQNEFSASRQGQQNLDFNQGKSLSTQKIKLSATYSASAAVAYADHYWSNYNPNFPSYANADCANFVSQCLNAGGLSTDGTWYSGSYAWINVGGMYNYLTGKGYKAYSSPAYSQYAAGDVIMFGNLAHTMLCVGQNSAGTPLYNAHTTNRYHEPLSYYWDSAGNTRSDFYLIKMQGSTTPTNVTLKTNKTNYSIGENVILTPSANNASYFGLRIMKSSKTYLYKDKITSATQWTPQETGTYEAWVSAVSVNGTVQDSKHIYFTVYEHPQNVTLTSNKANYSIGENVVLTPSANNTSYFGIRITKNSKTYLYKDKITSAMQWIPQETGTYEAWVSAVSIAGAVQDSKHINFKVFELPKNVALTTSKKEYSLGESVALTPQGENISYYGIRIMLNEKTAYYNDKITSSIYWKPDSTGNYTAWVTAVSPVGACKDSSVITFSVTNPTTEPTPIPTPLPKNEFSDVAKDAWYAPYIYNLTEKGIINGITSTTFEPDGLITRAQFAKILAYASGDDLLTNIKENPFSDTKNHWANTSINWAYAHQIVFGTSATTFAPDSKITREQMAAMMKRYIEYKGLSISEKNQTTVFRDDNTISNWAKKDVYLMQKLGIISGYPDGTFLPQANAKRCEAAKMISVLLEQ